MLTAGLYHTLKINRISEPGLYLVDEEENEVLLPNRFVSLEHKVGEMLDVFVYHDSEDRIVASTEKPLVTVGQVGFLRVVDKTIHGVFLDWGLKAKDLFMPNRNQQVRMEIGSRYIVYLYTDNVTGRVVATAKLGGIIRNDELSVQLRDQVEIIVATESPIGYRVVINNRHWGMLYRNQIFKPVAVGDRMTAYISRITDDLRIDVSLQQQGYDEVKASADRLLELVRSAGGTLPLCDQSSPEEVVRLTQMSKKVFKRSVGYLMKQGRIRMDNAQISLAQSE